MLLPANALISEEKLTKHLLVFLPKDDKSKFLRRADYTLSNWRKLESDLRPQVLTQPAEFLEETPYGIKYAIYATLTGVNGIELKVITIWMLANQQARFVTLVPGHRINRG